MVTLDDAVADRQSEPRALVDILGRKERVEDLLQQFGFDALAMVAQTIAISVGQETFSSLSEGSGVSMSELMKRSSNLGIQVPFDVPNYAAQFAPSASMVADSVVGASDIKGDM